MEHARPPLALRSGAATVLPRPVLARVAAAIVRGFDRSHPKLLDNLGVLTGCYQSIRF